MRVSITILVLILAGGASAQDGWRLDNPNAPWDPRDRHFTFELNNKLWLFGGNANGTGPNDGGVWATSDGVNWSQEGMLPPGVPTAEKPVVLAFNGEMWILGGGQTNPSSLVFHSPDGINWTQEPDAPWPGRTEFAGVVFNGRMWIMGGVGAQQGFNDVWSTTDGVNWTQEVAAAAWLPRGGHKAVAFNNRIWINGGGDTQNLVLNHLWSSADGVNWVQETANAGWGPRAWHRFVVYRDRMWVMGGDYVDPQSQVYNFTYDDLWSSPDGVNWVKETSGTPLEDKRFSFWLTVFKNRIWLTGGGTTTIGHMNDVWSYGLHIAPDDQPQFVTYVDEPFSQTFEARVGDGPFDWTLLSGQMPAGMTLDTNTTSDTIVLQGTPTEKGTFPFTLQLEDADGIVIEQDYVFSVISPPPPAPDGSGGSAGGGCTAGPSGMPWLILAAAVTLTAAVLRRRDGSSASCR